MASDAYIGEIRLFAGNYTPTGWLECDGSVLTVSDSTYALVAILGSTYGGDGNTTFGLPNLKGSVPIHFGSGYNAGQTGTASFGVANPAASLRYIICSTDGTFPKEGQ